MTNGLLTSIRKRDRIRQKTLKKPNDISLSDNFHAYRNTLKNLIVKQKNEYYKSKITQNINNPKKTWEIINEITDSKRTHKTIKKIVDSDGNETSNKDPAKMADVFNKFFVSIGEVLASRLTEHQDIHNRNTTCDINTQTLYMTPADNTEIETCIMGLGSNSSAGPDGIPSRVLRKHRLHLLTPLTYLINLTMSEGIFPDVLKTAIVQKQRGQNGLDKL